MESAFAVLCALLSVHTTDDEAMERLDLSLKAGSMHVFPLVHLQTVQMSSMQICDPGRKSLFKSCRTPETVDLPAALSTFSGSFWIAA